MKLLRATIIAPVLSVVLAVGVFTQMQAYAVEDDTTDYHARVRAAAEQIPIRIGEWEGTDMTVPPAAGKLLHPNVLFSRKYRHASTGQRANLVFVQCFDSRDMGGHYPPNCYPGNGWTQAGPATRFDLQMWGREIPVAEYTFNRTEGSTTIGTVVYNFFILPARGIGTSMEEVRAASGDYRSRPYGAAQIQIMTDSATDSQQRLTAARELLEPLGELIGALHSETLGENP
jgi:hypothetical protein